MRGRKEDGYYKDGAYIAPIQAVARSVRTVAADEAVEVAECILMDAADNHGEGTGNQLSVPHLAILINAGATMRGLEERAAHHANGALTRHRELDAESIATVLLFGEEIAVMAERVPAKALPPFSPEALRLQGCGMLLDALATAVSYLEKTAPDPSELVKVVAITGGSEPASCAVSYAKALALIEAKRAAGWEFELLTV